jgi:hypothetical protein
MNDLPAIVQKGASVAAPSLLVQLVQAIGFVVARHDNADWNSPASVMPGDRKLLYQHFGAEFVQDKFDKATNFDQIERTEDRFPGTSFNATLGLSSLIWVAPGARDRLEPQMTDYLETLALACASATRDPGSVGSFTSTWPTPSTVAIVLATCNSLSN